MEELRFRGTHTGYLCLRNPVRPVRTIALSPDLHAVVVHDAFAGASSAHEIEIPFHLAPLVAPVSLEGDRVLAGAFAFRWRGAWDCTVEEAWVSPSYGVKVPTSKIVFRRSGPVAPLTVALAPAATQAERLWAWAEEATDA